VVVWQAEWINSAELRCENPGDLARLENPRELARLENPHELQAARWSHLDKLTRLERTERPMID
jgi:hypothetical protein